MMINVKVNLFHGPGVNAAYVCPARSMPVRHSPEKTRSMPLRQCRFLVPDVPDRALALARRRRILYLSSFAVADEQAEPNFSCSASDFRKLSTPLSQSQWRLPTSEPTSRSESLPT